MHIQISNRQRLIKLNTGQLHSMTSKLCEAVCDNLLSDPTAQFSQKAIKQLRLKASLSLVLLSNQGIRKINKQWRNKDAETDVLSFPLNLKEPPGEMPWELGEVFISAEKAAEQASSLNHSLRRELAFLFVHGFLHILGFDHERPKDQKDMFRRQKSILAMAGYPRSD